MGKRQDFWAMAGLLHDIDFEMYPDEHCIKAPELLEDAGVSDVIDTLQYVVMVMELQLMSKPDHQMEKVPFATDKNNRANWCSSKNEAIKECYGYGSIKLKEEI